MTILYYIFLGGIILLDILFPVFLKGDGDIAQLFLLQLLNSFCMPAISFLYLKSIEKDLCNWRIQECLKYCFSRHINNWVGLFLPIIMYSIISFNTFSTFTLLDFSAISLLLFCLIAILLSIIYFVKSHSIISTVYLNALGPVAVAFIAFTERLSSTNIIYFSIATILASFAAVLSSKREKLVCKKG